MESMIVSQKQRTLLDLFPIPEFLLLSTTGIVIKDTNIRFVQLGRKIFGNGFELVHASKVENPKGAIESGLIINPNEIANILRDFSLSRGVSYAKAILPEEKAYLFTADIDQASQENMRDAVAFIIEENVPISLTESIFDFEVIGIDKDTGRTKVAVSVLPRDIVNAYTALFESAGIVPISFDLESRAIARAVIYKGDKRSILIANFSTKKTGFYVVDEEVVQFSTTIGSGLVSSGHSSNSKELLQEEMRKVITFWNARASQSNKKIEKIVLCGSMSAKTNFVEAFIYGNEIPYAMADVWLKMSRSNDHVPRMTAEESLGYVSAIGLMLPRDR